MQILLLLLISFVTLPVMAKPSIEVRAHTVVQADKILHLGDITEFTDLSKELKATLADVVLGDAPAYGEKRVFTSHALSGIFRKHLSDKDQPVQLKIPSRVIIENKGFAIDRDAVKEALLEKWEKSCADCRLVLTRLVLPQVKKELLQYPWSLRVDDDLPRGSFSVALDFQGASSPVSNYWVTGTLEVEKQVPVATRMMYFGERIQEGDFKYVYRDVTFARDGIPQEKHLVGKRVKGTLRAEQIIWMNNIERDKALNRGDVVRVVSGSQGWQVTTTAVAQQDGYIGDVVKVKNPKSKKLVSVRVTGKGEVRVE